MSEIVIYLSRKATNNVEKGLIEKEQQEHLLFRDMDVITRILKRAGGETTTLKSSSF